MVVLAAVAERGARGVGRESEGRAGMSRYRERGAGGGKEPLTELALCHLPTDGKESRLFAVCLRTLCRPLADGKGPTPV